MVIRVRDQAIMIDVPAEEGADLIMALERLGVDVVMQRLAQCFTGLTRGLMSEDVVMVQKAFMGATPEQQEQYKKILGLPDAVKFDLPT